MPHYLFGYLDTVYSIENALPYIRKDSVMFESLRIRNYRLFESLEVNCLHRINLISGRNNSGKTNLLEAIFLLANGAYLESVLESGIFREPGQVYSYHPYRKFRQSEAFWKQLFYDLDINRTVDLEGMIETENQFEPLQRLTLSISIKRPEIEVIESIHDPDDGDAIRNGWGNSSLIFSSKFGERSAVEGHLVLRDKRGRSYISSGDHPPIEARILLPSAGDSHRDAIELASLRTKRQDGLISNALKIIEPRLNHIVDNSATGEPLIWADIDGLSELIPLSVMGSSMMHMTRIALAVVNASGGVILLDEIENGLHHSAMPEVWKFVAATAEKFDTQVFATTHSYECIQAAYKGLGKDGFRLHLLDVRNGGSHKVTFHPDETDLAIRHHIEVR